MSLHLLGSVPAEYTLAVIQPKLPDQNMQVSVNGEDSSKAILLNVGDTVVAIKVSSADGTNSQVGHHSLIAMSEVFLNMLYKFLK